MYVNDLLLMPQMPKFKTNIGTIEPPLSPDVQTFCRLCVLLRLMTHLGRWPEKVTENLPRAEHL